MGLSLIKGTDCALNVMEASFFFFGDPATLSVSSSVTILGFAQAEIFVSNGIVNNNTVPLRDSCVMR